MDPTLLALIRLSMLVLLPVFPAYLLFKALPSTAIVKGPLQGLNLDLSGAFGGYFALILTLIASHSVWSPAGGKVWYIDGLVVDESGNPMPALETTQVKVNPAPVNITGSGAFHVEFTTAVGNTGDPVYPSLTIGVANYLEEPISLDPGNSRANKSLQIEWDSNKQRIHISKIVLRRLPAYDGGEQAPAPVNTPVARVVTP